MSFLRRRPLLAGLAMLPVLALLFAGWMLLNARAMPVVRTAEIALPFPAGAPSEPVRVALLTDTHMSGPDNSPERMARIVAQINALKPDLILLGGDYMGDDKGGAIYSPAESIAPFAALRAPLGVIAALGNHDSFGKGNHRTLRDREWTTAFARVGVRLLQNGVVRAGPLVIGGLQDPYTRFPDIPDTIAAMKAAGGAPIVLAHGPDIFPALPDMRLLALVGHTHCGQVALPFFGIVYVPSRYGVRYACGVYGQGARTMIVSGGVGTSGLPFRLLAPPDIWLVTIRPS